MVSLRFRLARALLIAVVALGCFTQVYAQGPFPSIQILGLQGIPSGRCNGGNFDADVYANGDSSTSEEFNVLVGNQLVNSFSETMDWANPPGPSDFGWDFEGSFAANTVITGQLITYNRSNQGGDPATAGQPVYLSEIRFDCTTGAQVGAIVNRPLGAPTAVPTTNAWQLVLISILLLTYGVTSLRLRKL